MRRKLRSRILELAIKKNMKVISSFLKLQKEVSLSLKRHYVFLIIIMFIVGVLESISTAWIAIFASILSDPESFMRNEIFIRILGNLRFIESDNIGLIIISGSIIMTLLITIKNIVRGVSRYFTAKYSASVSALFGKRIMERVLNRPYKWYLKSDPAIIQQTIMWRKQISLFLISLLQAFSDIIIVISLFATLLIYNFVVSGPIIIFISLMAFAIYAFIKSRILKNEVKIKNLEQESFSTMRTILNGYKNIRVYGIEDSFLNKFRDPLFRSIRLNGKKAFWTGSPVLFLESLGFAALTAAIIIMLLIMDASASSTLALLALLGVTAWRILPAINRYLGMQARIQSNIPYIESFMEMYYDEEREDIRRPSESEYHERTISNDSPSIAFDNVSFSYELSNERAIEDISFQVEAGEKIAIVGTSGSGKTTLLDLLTGLLEPDSGKIVLNIGNAKKTSSPEWRSKLNYLPQKVSLMTGSFAENIAFGETSGIDSDRVQNAYRHAELDDVISKRLNSQDTQISDDGKNLSGGQAQRIGVARMFYRDSDIWIIDEGTASLDRVTERKILDNIFRVGEGKIIFFITHRLETLEYCDKVLALENGRKVYFDDIESVLPSIKNNQGYFHEDSEDDVEQSKNQS